MKHYLVAALFFATTTLVAEDVKTNHHEAETRIEYVTDIQHGLNFLEWQRTDSFGHVKLVTGLEALGFADTKLLGWRAGVPVTVKGVTFVPSIMLAYNTHTGQTCPGVAVRFENEFLNGKLYTQGLLGWLSRCGTGKPGVVMVADPLEGGIRPFTGKFQKLQLGASIEKYNGEFVLGILGGHQAPAKVTKMLHLPKDTEITVQAVPPLPFFQKYSHTPGHDPIHNITKLSWLVRGGFVIKWGGKSHENH